MYRNEHFEIHPCQSEEMGKVNVFRMKDWGIGFPPEIIEQFENVNMTQAFDWISEQSNEEG